jgi:hypothetical protein
MKYGIPELFVSMMTALDRSFCGHAKGSFGGVECRRFSRFEMADGGVGGEDGECSIPLKASPLVLLWCYSWIG